MGFTTTNLFEKVGLGLFGVIILIDIISIYAIVISIRQLSLLIRETDSELIGIVSDLNQTL